MEIRRGGRGEGKGRERGEGRGGKGREEKGEKEKGLQPCYLGQYYETVCKGRGGCGERYEVGRGMLTAIGHDKAVVYQTMQPQLTCMDAHVDGHTAKRLQAAMVWCNQKDENVFW